VSRSCGVCGNSRFETLHRQDFLLPGELRTHYTVVACERCGFTFARDLPAAEEYEAYYRSTTKYTYEGSVDAAAAHIAMHEPSFRLADGFLSSRPDGGRDLRMLDIGCSTGELLALFSRAGYRRLEGVDPTPECVRIARQLYGLDVRPGVLSEITTAEPYDLVFLANVFEHIPDLRDAVARVAALVREGGLLFVQVPDADNFGVDLKEPFLEFSIEHINYFTEASLANLLAFEGFTRAAVEHDVQSYKGASYPVITSLWQRDSRRVPAPEQSDSSVLRAYIEKCRTHLGELERTINALVDSGEPLAIWGVGSLTARLLATTRLGEANIVAFIDSNSGQHGKRLIGREIFGPAWLGGKDATVLVSSFVYGAEIRRTLEHELHYGGRIVTI
jgi:SAM-dependent methyltransferase